MIVLRRKDTTSQKTASSLRCVGRERERERESARESVGGLCSLGVGTLSGPWRLRERRVGRPQPRCAVGDEGPRVAAFGRDKCVDMRDHEIAPGARRLLE